MFLESIKLDLFCNSFEGVQLKTDVVFLSYLEPFGNTGEILYLLCMNTIQKSSSRLHASDFAEVFHT